jgi:hypothetical protein
MLGVCLVYAWCMLKTHKLVVYCRRAETAYDERPEQSYDTDNPHRRQFHYEAASQEYGKCCYGGGHDAVVYVSFWRWVGLFVHVVRGQVLYSADSAVSALTVSNCKNGRLAVGIQKKKLVGWAVGQLGGWAVGGWAVGGWAVGGWAVGQLVVGQLVVGQLGGW